MPDLALVSVIASFVIGSLGIIVPAITKCGDRKHEEHMEQVKADMEWRKSVREQRATVYAKALEALRAHQACDDDPWHTLMIAYPDAVAKWSKDDKARAEQDLPLPDPPSPPEWSLDSRLAWSHKREAILASIALPISQWGSVKMQTAWTVLEHAADHHDNDFLIDNEASQSHKNELASGRDHVQKQVAVDLQGQHLYEGVHVVAELKHR